MALLLKNVLQNYRYVMIDAADPRTNDWPLIRSPVGIACIIAAYLFFVMDFGPKLMKDRKPVDLKNVLLVYNSVQILANGYLVVFGYHWVQSMDWRCGEIFYVPEHIDICYKGYVYFAIKVMDLLDTVFFVLRKNDRQITFLHVYHHAIMIVISWLGVKYLCGGHSVYLPFINSFVHVVMYGYYLLSAYDSSYKRSTWWKKYITQLQLLQFGLLLFLYAQPLIGKCDFPKWPVLLIIPQNFVMLVLFADFYYTNYVKKSQ